MTGTLTRLSSSNDNLRTRDVRGSFEALPAQGKRFNMVAPALDHGDGRLVSTSPVTRVAQEGSRWEFWTESSHYVLAVDQPN